MFFANVYAQTAPGPAKQKLLDSLCLSLNKINLDAIKTKKAASDAFMDVFSERSDMLIDVAKEENVEMTDQPAMRQLGIDIGKSLLKEKCSSFMKLAIKMAKDEESEAVGSGATTGLFARVDTKGFNYIVIKDQSGIEKSFLWLEPFKGSESFMKGADALKAKKISVKWHEIEVYMPEA